MTERRKRVCIIGAGSSGLCSLKNSLEANLDVICYEKSNDIGGLWNRGNNAVENQVTVAESTTMNTSKEMFAFSDFPPPEDWPNWMHHTTVCQYLKMYAKRFSLMDHIRFNSTVEKVVKSADYDATGCWNVYLSDGGRETYDCVMICSGQYSDSYVPNIDGIDTFKGSIIHSKMFKNWRKYENKRVLVVGFGNSSMDIATELARSAKQVYVSTRRGCWMWSRMGIRGWPVDVRYESRIMNDIFNITPKYLLNCYFEHNLNMRIDHTDYGLKPKHRFLSQQRVFGDQVPTCISNGSLIIKDGVKKIEENSVVFVDGTDAIIDAIIFCTGYTVSFPFIDEQLNPIKKDNVNLYKFVFPPDLPHPTLAFVGFVQSSGGIGPVSEMQSRWVTRIFNRQLHLPCLQEIQKDIVNSQNWINDTFYKSPRHKFQVSYVDYMNELASFVGIRPNMLKLFFTDPKLFYHCYVGPCTAYTYRLADSKSPTETRNIILKTNVRIDKPVRNRRGEPAIWKPFDDRYVLGSHIFDWTFAVLVPICWVTFGTDNNLLFYVSTMVMFSYLAILAAISDLFFDYSTSF